jgi:hypothetical protein
MSIILRASEGVDSRRTDERRSGTAVEHGSWDVPTVDEWARRPRSVLTPTMALTCDDVRRPQFPQALLLRRILFYEGQTFIEAVDDERRWLP